MIRYKTLENVLFFKRPNKEAEKKDGLTSLHKIIVFEISFFFVLHADCISNLFLILVHLNNEFIRSYSTGRTPLEPALQLEKDYPIQLRFIPRSFHTQQCFGGNLIERNRLNWNKVQYLYLDRQRFANERGLIIREPEHSFDSRLSLIAGLYADKHQFFHQFASRTFELFFKRQLNIENIDEIIKLLYETSRKDKTLEEFSQDFQKYLNNQGQQDYLNAEKEAEQDHVFDVPMFIIRDELFWGHDRISWIKNKLDSLKLQNN
ncbi:unnamed protein product [Rotaria socialis]